MRDDLRSYFRLAVQQAEVWGVECQTTCYTVRALLLLGSPGSLQHTGKPSHLLLLDAGARSYPVVEAFKFFRSLLQLQSWSGDAVTCSYLTCSQGLCCRDPVRIVLTTPARLSLCAQHQQDPATEISAYESAAYTAPSARLHLSS